MSRREAKAPARDTAGSTVSASTAQGAKRNSASNPVVLGEPSTEDTPHTSAPVHTETVSGGETVTEDSTGAEETTTTTSETHAPLAASSSSHVDSAEPSTDIYVPTAPESAAATGEASDNTQPQKSGGLLSRFTENFTGGSK